VIAQNGIAKIKDFDAPEIVARKLQSHENFADLIAASWFSSWKTFDGSGVGLYFSPIPNVDPLTKHGTEWSRT
jgi:hypothetical protein